MTSLLTESALANGSAIDVAPAQSDSVAWLRALLASYDTHPPPPPLNAALSDRLKVTSFEEVVTAIEQSRPALAGSAEIRLYQEWIAANDGSPFLFAAWFNLGVTFARESDPGRAATAYANARRINSGFYPAAVNLGLTLESIGQTDAAIRAWENAVQADDARIALLNQKGRLLEGLGRLHEAESTLRTSLLTNNAQPDAVQHWLHVRQKLCLWPVLSSDIPSLSQPDLLRQSGPLGILALTDDVALQREVAGQWIERKMPPMPIRLSPPGGYDHQRIRVGYLSSDFCRHAMSFLIAELFERHDRSRFEVYGYCSTLEDGSDIRRRVVAAFDHYRLIRDMPDEQAARLIRDDEIDILIDLNGLTARTRLALMRWRPAPIQATYLGFIGPVPLPELDYLLCDDFVVPPEQAAAYSPAPLSIGRLYQANDSKRAVGRPLSRQEAGLPDGRFVFCCFSNYYKITEAVFRAWMAILRNADGAVLWLTADNAAAQANLQAHAAREGVSPERILFAERTSPELYLSRLALADVFLDTFPYNAGTVASDAIRMQLPLLTLSGAAFASRMAGSLLTAIGAPQGIATNLSEYIAIGTMLATDANAYAAYKQRFTVDAWKNTLGNIEQFTAEFEATLMRVVANRDGAVDSAVVRPRPRGLPETAERPAETEDPGIIALITTVEQLTRSGQIEASLERYDLWLQRHPVDPFRHIACFNYGTLLNRVGNTKRAAEVLEEAIRIKPDFLAAYINAGLALERQGALDQAVARWLQVADRLVPIDEASINNKTTALKHVSRVYKSVSKVESAEEALRRCLAIDPSQRDAIQHWIALRQMQCKWPVFQPWGRLSRTDLMAAISPLTLAIHTNDPMYQLARAWHNFEQDILRLQATHTVGHWVPPASASAPRRPLRIGYVSPDLREHAIGFLTAELFELHDRTNVEVFAYYSGQPGPDALQERIKGAVDHWRVIVGLSDTQVAHRIVTDEIDILVDLGGHTGDSPGAAFALRPAPVIVNWLGYPGSMGTPCHQYIIADEITIPPAYEKYYSERVIRLPCYQPTDRKRIVARTPSRQEVGLGDDAMVYCCFNGTQKINPALFQTWMAILARAPHGVLWLLSCDTATDDRLRQQAALHGIAPDRLIFAPRRPNAEHLARFPLADLFLDTSPYGAHTTASDALWMGLPVLTMIGHSFASRVCGSLVRAAGLDDLVCDHPKAYEDLAVALGSQPARLIGLRETLRGSRDRCTLFDMPLLVARLEAGYQQMWNEFLSGRIPEPDLTNLAIYDDIGNEFDHEVQEVIDLHTYEHKYRTALAYRDNISPLVSDHRLWTGRRDTRMHFET